MKNYYVYIMTNIRNKVLYIGITNDLVRRVYEHRQKLVEGFTERYNVTKLIHYEIYTDVELAIIREKKLKKKNRNKKVQLINKYNSKWKDLYNEIL